ncbi:hypothetical protein AB1K83_16815 [Sporosarcina sp. 179-K 3D1 HS]|uniref:hypothetical protein n=1 Tax=Sporosarcina sp. 179-K 3D1 HS TaxID=3232169 RepID=UPI0039A21F45
MNEKQWSNVFKILDKYTQYKHYQLLFDRFRLSKKQSREEMRKELVRTVTDTGFLGPIMSPVVFEEWLALHQINGNNYTFVYNLEERVDSELLQNAYLNKNSVIEINLFDINIDNDSENLATVMPGLNDIKLTQIHRDKNLGTYTFSFVSPCEVTGTRTDGSSRTYKNLFFCHCVFFEYSNDVKIIFNPTSNLLNVNGIKKDRYDWTPISNMIFNKVKQYIGKVYLKAPLWIPQALYQFAEDATGHNNPEITAHSFNAESQILKFAEDLLKKSEIDTDNEPALLSRFIQDIQISFESQLMEIYAPVEDSQDSFAIFKQRSDGVSHIISVESTEEGFKYGSAAQAAKRSRQDGDIDLLGVNLKTNNRTYKFLVEQGSDAYLIRGTNTFIEEEVVNIVVRKLNEYREQIRLTTSDNPESGEGAAIP